MKKILCMLSCVIVLGACGSSDTRLFQQAKLATSKGDLMGAIQLYSRLLKQNPNHAAALTNRGVLWERVQAKDKEERAKNLGFAEEDYLKALSINPNQPETYNNLGGLYLDKKRSGGNSASFQHLNL